MSGIIDAWRAFADAACAARLRDWAARAAVRAQRTREPECAVADVLAAAGEGSASSVERVLQAIRTSSAPEAVSCWPTLAREWDDYWMTVRAHARVWGFFHEHERDGPDMPSSEFTAQVFRRVTLANLLTNPLWTAAQEWRPPPRPNLLLKLARAVQRRESVDVQGSKKRSWAAMQQQQAQQDADVQRGAHHDRLEGEFSSQQELERRLSATQQACLAALDATVATNADSTLFEQLQYMGRVVRALDAPAILALLRTTKTGIATLAMQSATESNRAHYEQTLRKTLEEQLLHASEVLGGGDAVDSVKRAETFIKQRVINAQMTVGDRRDFRLSNDDVKRHMLQRFRSHAWRAMRRTLKDVQRRATQAASHATQNEAFTQFLLELANTAQQFYDDGESYIGNDAAELEDVRVAFAAAQLERLQSISDEFSALNGARGSNGNRKRADAQQLCRRSLEQVKSLQLPPSFIDLLAREDDLIGRLHLEGAPAVRGGPTFASILAQFEAYVLEHVVPAIRMHTVPEPAPAVTVGLPRDNNKLYTEWFVDAVSWQAFGASLTRFRQQLDLADGAFNATQEATLAPLRRALASASVTLQAAFDATHAVLAITLERQAAQRENALRQAMRIQV